MIIEDEGWAICEYNENASIGNTVLVNPGQQDLNSFSLTNDFMHANLQADLTEHIWKNANGGDGEIGAIDALKWLDEMETVVDISGCAAKDTVKFVSQSFKEDALTWWKALIQSTDKVEMYSLSWSKFVELICETYCPPHEVEKVETDFLKLTMKGLECRAYLSDYNSLSRLVPYLITPEPKRIARSIGGLAPEIKGMVKSSKPAAFRSAMDLALSLTEDEIRARAIKAEEDHKRKRDDTPSKDFKKGKTGSNYNQSKPNEAKPKCKTCGKQHFGKCSREQNKGCGICKEMDHKSHECKNLKDATCYGCGEKGHIKTRCPKRATDGKNKATDGQKGND
ncbi:uncharacterized protein LOC110919112 [Helianthus annuus]|uniref:uncharacterized protein LOC110919112 n=1 Tax=Helianthus annuus TaxID=4232 RepID=UPI000B9080F0|nr:uncharacterized protein LOC110919112 [Helianthus annuus]